jgi:hypothetical protein
MCFFPVLFWCSAVVDDAEVRTVFAAIPRFGGRESPVRFSTGIRVQRLDFRNHFCSQQRLRGGIRRNSRFDGKNRQFLPANCSADWRRALKAIEGNRNFVFPCCVRALGAPGSVAAAKLRKRCASWSALHRIFRLGSLRKIGSADEARLQSDLDLLREAHLPG